MHFVWKAKLEHQVFRFAKMILRCGRHCYLESLERPLWLAPRQPHGGWSAPPWVSDPFWWLLLLWCHLDLHWDERAAGSPGCSHRAASSLGWCHTRAARAGMATVAVIACVFSDRVDLPPMGNNSQLQLHYATLQLQLHNTTLHPAVVGDMKDQIATATIATSPKKHNSNHLAVNQRVRSAIRASQQPTSPIGFLLWNFRHCLVR